MATQGYDETAGLVESRSRFRQTDVYMALGLGTMASTETYQDGTHKAIRSAKNMASFNCLYVDVDVNATKNGAYASTADAELGLEQFQKASGMPAPTMLVRSGGGGFHVYWCTAEPMPIAVWQPLADALKAAAQQLNFRIDDTVTADAARILRVPGTFNYKYGEPRLVTLDMTASSLQQYTAEDLGVVLAQYRTVTSSRTAPAPARPAPLRTRRYGRRSSAPTSTNVRSAS